VGTFDEGNLGAAGASAEHGTAVHTLGEAFALEQIQIAADGLRGDAEPLGQREHGHASVLSQHRADLILPFARVHPASLPVPTEYEASAEIAT